MNYENKYFKYKQKYLKLKGGVDQEATQVEVQGSEAQDAKARQRYTNALMFACSIKNREIFEEEFKKYLNEETNEETNEENKIIILLCLCNQSSNSI